MSWSFAGLRKDLMHHPCGDMEIFRKRGKIELGIVKIAFNTVTHFKKKSIRHFVFLSAVRNEQ